MRKITEAQRRKAAQEAYARRVKEGRVDNTYLNFDDWYERYAITDLLFLSIISEMEQDASSYESSSDSSYDTNSSTNDSSSYDYSSDSSSSSSSSSSYDSGSSYDGGSDSSY